jgi:hypothetical protein
VAGFAYASGRFRPAGVPTVGDFVELRGRRWLVEERLKRHVLVANVELHFLDQRLGFREHPVAPEPADFPVMEWAGVMAVLARKHHCDLRLNVPAACDTPAHSNAQANNVGIVAQAKKGTGAR